MGRSFLHRASDSLGRDDCYPPMTAVPAPPKIMENTIKRDPTKDPRVGDVVRTVDPENSEAHCVPLTVRAVVGDVVGFTEGKCDNVEWRLKENWCSGEGGWSWEVLHVAE